MENNKSKENIYQNGSMETIIPDNLSDLIDEMFKGIVDSSRCCVWRGQTNISWNPYPGLYRRLLNNGYGLDEIDERLVRQYETDILCEANGLGFYGEGGASRLDFMINFQHEGGATRLLDVTWNPFIALWFATSNTNENVAGAIYCYQVDSNCCPLPEQVMSWDDITSSCQEGRPVIFTPQRINERIKAQSSSFLTGVLDEPLSHSSIFTHSTKYSDVKCIYLKPVLKRKASQWLFRYRRMRQFDIFPDFSGYAQANSQKSRFARSLESLYDGADGLFPSSWAPGC